MRSLAPDTAWGIVRQAGAAITHQDRPAARATLAAALGAVNDEPAGHAAPGLLLTWAAKRQARAAPLTVHTNLDHLRPFLESLPPAADAETLTDLILARGDDLADFPAAFGVSFRQFWRWLTDGRPGPKAGGATIAARPHALRSGDELDALLDALIARAEQRPMGRTLAPIDCVLAWLLLTCQAQLRFAEAARLRLGDVWPDGQQVHLALLGKGNKRRSRTVMLEQPWMGDYLAWFWETRWGAAPQADALCFPAPWETAAKAYPRLYRQLKAVAFEDSLHALRRYGANRDAARGVELITIIQRLGHSTTVSAPGNYIGVAALIGQARLLAWAAERDTGGMPELSPRAAAARFGRSYEWARRKRLGGRAAWTQTLADGLARLYKEDEGAERRIM